MERKLSTSQKVLIKQHKTKQTNKTNRKTSKEKQGHLFQLLLPWRAKTNVDEERPRILSRKLFLSHVILASCNIAEILHLCDYSSKQ